MVRVSITGILTLLGTVLLMLGVTAAVPAASWEPVCRATNTFQRPCLRALVSLELASTAPSVPFEHLIDWCGDDELCRIEVLDGRPAGDSHTERALCEMWAPSYALACEQGVSARHGGIVGLR